VYHCTLTREKGISGLGRSGQVRSDFFFFQQSPTKKKERERERRGEGQREKKNNTEECEETGVINTGRQKEKEEKRVKFT
jgi:hypothetical protein